MTLFTTITTSDPSRTLLRIEPGVYRASLLGEPTQQILADGSTATVRAPIDVCDLRLDKAVTALVIAAILADALDNLELFMGTDAPRKLKVARKAADKARAALDSAWAGRKPRRKAERPTDAVTETPPAQDPAVASDPAADAVEGG